MISSFSLQVEFRQDYYFAINELKKEDYVNYPIIKKALEAINQNKTLPNTDKLSIYSNINLKKLKEKIEDLGTNLIDSIIQELNYKIRLTFGERFTDLPVDVLSHIIQFAPWEERKNLSYVNKELHTIFSTLPETCILAEFKKVACSKSIKRVFSFLSANKKTKKEVLNLPEGYFENLSYYPFARRLPFLDDKTITAFLLHASLFESGSNEEKLAFYLMKHCFWSVEFFLKHLKRKETPLLYIANEINKVFKYEDISTIDTSVLENARAWSVKKGQTLAETIYFELNKDKYVTHTGKYTDNKDVIMSAYHYNIDALEYANKELQLNKEFILSLIIKFGKRFPKNQLRYPLTIDPDIINALKKFY